jgi:hypothetical protein
MHTFGQLKQFKFCIRLRLNFIFFVFIIFSIFQNLLLVSNENTMLVPLNTYEKNLSLFSSICEL